MGGTVCRPGVLCTGAVHGNGRLGDVAAVADHAVDGTDDDAEGLQAGADAAEGCDLRDRAAVCDHAVRGVWGRKSAGAGSDAGSRTDPGRLLSQRDGVECDDVHRKRGYGAVRNDIERQYPAGTDFDTGPVYGTGGFADPDRCSGAAAGYLQGSARSDHHRDRNPDGGVAGGGSLGGDYPGSIGSGDRDDHYDRGSTECTAAGYGGRNRGAGGSAA